MIQKLPAELVQLKELMDEQMVPLARKAALDPKGSAAAWMAKGDSLVLLIIEPRRLPRMYLCRVLDLVEKIELADDGAVSR